MDDPAEFLSKSAQPTAKETNERPITGNIHDRLQTNSSNTIDRTDQPETPHNSGSPQTGIEEIPTTPQQNLVQSTTTQGHGSDQHTPIPISEHRTVHTHGQGINPTRPLKDESTQIPSQEALMITSNQGTQFPSQQWEQTPKSKDQEDTQYETHMPERAVSHTSCQRTRVPGTHPSSPTEPSPAKTHIADEVESHILTDSRPAGTRETKTPETNQSMESNNAKVIEPEHTMNDDSESDGITDFNIPNEDHPTSPHITTCAKPRPVDTKGNGKPVPPQTQNTCTPDKFGTYTITKTKGDKALDTSHTIEEQTTGKPHVTTQVDHESTGVRDIEHPAPMQNKTAESQQTGVSIYKIASKKSTLYQHPHQVRDNAEIKKQESSAGTTITITKVTDNTNSEITTQTGSKTGGIAIEGTDAPMTITISESSSDDDTQEPAVRPLENRPDQNFQELLRS